MPCPFWQFQTVLTVLKRFLLLFVLVFVVPASAEENHRLARLRQGEILSEGGHLDKKGVWGRVEGVIEAPPELVWQIFYQANEWRRYGLPSLADSRSVTEEIAREVGSSQKAGDFYKVLGERVFDPSLVRRKRSTWTSYAFQFYNIPWPLADRWMIVKTDFDETGLGKGVYKAQWTKAAGNVRTVDGTLLLTPFEGNKRTLVSYDVVTDPGSNVPKFILRWGVKKTMPAAVRAIRNEAKKIQRPSVDKSVDRVDPISYLFLKRGSSSMRTSALLHEKQVLVKVTAKVHKGDLRIVRSELRGEPSALIRQVLHEKACKIESLRSHRRFFHKLSLSDFDERRL